MPTTDPRPLGLGIRPFPGEPLVQGWSRTTWWELAVAALARGGRRAGPVLLAVDGRSGAGKTSAAERLAEVVPGAAIVHTDDVAWHESFFDWDHLLAAHVLRPLRQGQAVSFRPPAWADRGREGAISVLADAPMVIVEGVGSSRRGLTTLLDGAVWVQSDHAEARRRGLEREGGSAGAIAFWDEWSRAEEAFLAQDRPWERAWVTVCGTPELLAAGLGADEVLVAGADFGGFQDAGPACRC